jgi:phosphohistidine phosphatase SixA
VRRGERERERERAKETRHRINAPIVEQREKHPDRQTDKQMNEWEKEREFSLSPSAIIPHKPQLAMLVLFKHQSCIV